MIAARCEAGGTCGARARWVLTAADLDEPSVAACPTHLADARALLSKSTSLLIKRVGPREIPRCEWLMAGHGKIERCAKPGKYAVRYEDATLRFCSEHRIEAEGATA